MKTPTLSLGCLALLALARPSFSAAQDRPASEARRPVDVAICLDTSGSMQGLIDAARLKLWSIVNELARAQPTPRLRVALLTFGNDGHDATAGWVKIDSELTDDLDTISQQLFALTTNGGTELVGRVLKNALENLDWCKDRDALRLIFVAGNESAEQDQEVDFREVVKRAIEQDIVVNSIYCGGPEDGEAPAWKEVSLRADGQFACIDQNHGTVAIETPFDKKLSELSTSINETYLWFGPKGAEMAKNQIAQDLNAAGQSSAGAAGRACTKGGQLYVCQNDLVDSCAEESFKLEDVKKEDLPEGMREMTLEQKKARVAEMRARRDPIRKEIQKIDGERRKFIAEEMKKIAKEDDRSFDGVVLEALREQARKRGFSFPEPAVAPPLSKDASGG